MMKSWLTVASWGFVVVVACAPMRAASYANAESICAQNPAPCEQACQTDPHGAECAVALVRKGRQIVHGEVTPDPSAVLSMHGWLGDLCGQGFDRACAMDQDLGPSYEKAHAAHQASQAAATQGVEAQDAAKADFRARADRVRDGARDVLKALDADEASCLPTPMGTTRLNCGKVGAQRAGDIIAAVNRVTKCGMGCTAQLNDAEKQLAGLQHDMQDANARRADKQALDDAIAACTADIATCKSECSGNPGSLKCLVLADMADTGDARLTQRRDAVKALDLSQRACCAGNQRACNFADSIRQKTTSLWTGVQTVGDRLASNRYTLATVLQLRPTARNQRDVETARRMEPSFIAQEYCPARAAFIEQVGLAEFQRRAAEHCRTTPPTAQGSTGAQVPLPQQCASIYATQCPGTPAGPPTTRTTEVTCCPNGLTAIHQRLGCGCAGGDPGVQAPPPGPTCTTLNPRAEGSACIWSCQ
jgi:hypothetical protein